jgi:hypothetical protein
MKTDNKEKLSKIEISGRFLTKEIDGKSVVTLSEEVSASILNLSSQNSFNYCIYLVNNDRNENSNWEHLSFDIKPSMNLSNFIYKEVDCFQWFTQKNVYFLEVFLDESNERNKNNFWKVLEQCLCSVNKNIPIDRASLVISKTSQRYVKRIGEIKDLVVHVDTMVKQLEELNKKKLLEETITKEMQYLQITPPKLDEILNLEVAKKIYNTQGEIYNYDTNKDQLVNLNKDKKVMLTVYKLDSQRFDYVLCIETGNGLLLSIDRISEEINGQILDNQDSKFFCWITTKCYTNIVGDCLGFLFDKKEDSDQLRKILDKCNYEFKNKQAYETVDEENRKILENATDYSHIDCFSSDEEEDTKDKEEEEKKEEEKEKEEKKEKKSKKSSKKNRKEIMDIDEDKYAEVESSKEKLNKFCVDSLSNDRTFCVTDDNQIVVYKASMDDDTIEKLTSMPVVQEYKGKNVCFSHGLLYKSENNMLLLDDNNPYIVYQYDLPKEKIVNEWKTDRTQIYDICPLKKNGQKTDEPLIYGVNPKAVFTLDERVKNKNNIVDIKTYSTRNNANIIMSNYSGQFATGSTKGDLRFYDKVGTKAKNLFSFYGDPIRFIDISSDDQYILLTCDKYLLLVNGGNKDGEKNAFLKMIKTDERKTPVRLQIKTTDVAKYGLAEANYTKAKFNVNKNGENNIVTSLGEYIIVWNYNDIRKGKISNYKIKKVNDLIIDNYFKGGQGDKIIIAMPNKVRIQKQKKLFG